MNKPRLEDKDKVAKVYNSKGEVCETFSFRDHGNSYLSAAQNYLMQNYDKLMAEEVEHLDEVSGEKLGKYIVAAREKEKEEKKKGQEFVQRLKDAGMKGFGAPLYHKGAHFGKASRENMIKLATNKLTNPDFPVSNRVKVPATEEVEHITEMHKLKLHSTKKEKAKGHGTSLYKSPATVKSYDVHRNEPGHSLHGEKVGEIHHVENDDGPSFHGNLYGKNLPDYNAPGKLTAQKFLDHLERTGFAKKASEMKEEVEQMDEAHKINDPVEIVKGPGKGTKGYIGEIRHGLYKGAPKIYTVFHGEHGATQVDKEHIRKIKGEVKQMDEDLKRLEESEGHSIVKKLKADGKHEEAGKMAFKHGLSRSYGPHFGMRSTKDKDERDFHRGYDIANMESKKKRAGADRAFVAESNSDSAVEGYKNAIIHRLHNMKHPETGENLMFHSLKKHGLDKVKDAVDSSAEFHGEGAEEIGGSDVTAATHTALYHLGEKELVDKLRANARKPLEERSLTPAEEKKKEEIIMAMKEKGEPRYGAATAIAKRVAENKIYTNVIAKLEEGRKPKPPAEGKKPSAAWLRQQEREKTGETETPNFTDQLHKHKDQGELGTGMIKFKDGSSHKVSHEQREKALRFMRSLVGPGKNPDVRDKKIAEMGKSHAHFLHHIGEKPMDSEKLHPMSAQKK